MMMMIASCLHGEKGDASFLKKQEGIFNALPEDLKARLCMRMRRHFVTLPSLSLYGTNSSSVVMMQP
eukprot:3423861-Ditylum_brightwellii.AAC.1